VHLDRFFEGRDPAWVTRTAEEFYVGLGFGKLPETFWSRSDLFPARPGEARLKNSHSSCWHIDLGNDIRSLMSVEANPWWFTTAHHELGHAYYLISYTRPEVPPLLRIGANPAFHEGIGELIGLAAGQLPYLKSKSILPANYPPDEVAVLLNDALAHSIPFLFWASGTMTHWGADVYAGELSPTQWNARWWKHVAEYQGVEAPGGPGSRGEDWCDAATKTHINDNPCYYYSYAVATVLKFQFHDHIARKILRHPPRAAITPGTGTSEPSSKRCWPPAAPATGVNSCGKPPAKTSAPAPWSSTSNPWRPGSLNRTADARSAGTGGGGAGRGMIFALGRFALTER